MIVRAATASDADALAAIYGHHVLHGVGGKGVADRGHAASNASQPRSTAQMAKA